VWSADPAQIWSFPARFLVEFFENHGMLGFRGRPHWRTIVGGSRRYVEALIRPWRVHPRLSTPVTEVARHPGHVTVSCRGRERERFDAVVIATHSDQALALLADPSERERELLGAIPYQQNEVVLHTDRSLLPRRRRAWASWNVHLGDGAPGRCTVTYHLNALQSLRADREFCVTLNRTEAIDPEQIICKMQYAHPIYTPAGVAAQARHHEISGRNRTYYCGAYWGWGFHEDGLRSAQRVADELTLQRTDPVRI
jgi:predicted NAD/FAD-binding protein